MCAKPTKARDFAVVEFDSDSEDEGKSVGVIPTIWLSDDGTLCSYPPRFKATSYARKQKPIESTWSRYPVRILKFCGKILLEIPYRGLVDSNYKCML